MAAIGTLVSSPAAQAWAAGVCGTSTESSVTTRTTVDGSSAVLRANSEPARFCGLRKEAARRVPLGRQTSSQRASGSQRQVAARASAAVATSLVGEAVGDVLAEEERELAAKPHWRGGGKGRGRVKSKRLTQANSEIVAEGQGPKLDWLKQEGVDLSTERTIWRVNRSIARSSTVREALEVVEEMKKAGLNAANEGTYVALITVCRRQRQGERALVVYQAMKQAGVRPGMLTFNTLISCCQQAQRVEDAFKLKEDMEEIGLKPDVVTYTALMALVVKASPYRGRSSPAQRLSRALDLFREMQQRGVLPDAITFNTLMYAGAQAKLPGKVLEVYGMMSSAGVAANQFTFSILLEAVGQGGRLKAALEVFNEMKAAGVPPQTKTYNFLMEACAAAPQPDAAKAWELYEEMKSVQDGAPNKETLCHLITASCKGGDHEGAMRAFQLLQEKGHVSAISVSTFNKLINSAYVAEGLEGTFKMYANMREAGYSPDVVTYGSLVSACGREGQLERALEVSREMEALGIRPNQATYHALMGAYGKAGQWEAAIQNFRDMQRNCPDEPAGLASYSIAFDACFGSAGADAAVSEAVACGRELEVEASPGVRAAVELYEEGARSGLFKNFSDADLSRCDVRQSTRAVMIVCVIAWLERIKKSPINGDLVLVTGSDKGRGVMGAKKGRFPKLFVSADRTLQALGLKGKSLRTLTMQALSVDKATVESWRKQLPGSPRSMEDDKSDKSEAISTELPATSIVEVAQ